MGRQRCNGKRKGELMIECERDRHVFICGDCETLYDTVTCQFSQGHLFLSSVSE